MNCLVERQNMISEFITFCESLFPSISPYTAEQARKAMDQFESVNGNALTKKYNDNELYQGDIFSEIPFFYYGDDGGLNQIRCKAQLLSNTCDSVRDKNLLFAAVLTMDDFNENKGLVSAIRANKKYNTFYLPDQVLANEFVDFEMINFIPRDVFLELLKQKKVTRIASLNQIGYYMLICKLTVFFMRPEDTEVNQSRLVY